VSDIPTKVADAILGIDLTRYTTKVLDVSTAMIPEHTADALGQGRTCERTELWNELAYEPWGEYGWIVWAHDDPTCIPTTVEKHPELAALLKFAATRGFGYVKLDCDADRLPEACGLPTFSW
jgi:hypothetical protein